MRARRTLLLVLHSGNFKANSGNAGGGIGKHRPASPQTHLHTAVGIFEQRAHLSLKILRQVLVIVDNYRTADSLDYAGITELLHVAMKRIRNKNRGAGGQGHIRDCTAPGTSHHDGRAGQGFGNVLYKRNYFRLNRNILVLRPQQLHIRIPTLVKERHFITLFPRF